MSYRSVFATAALTDCNEYGLGYALRDEQGKYLCGFLQPDSTIAFATFRQFNDSWNDNAALEINTPYQTDRPLFLSGEEMEERGIAAAVFGLKCEALCNHGLPQDIADSCRLIYVCKDETHNAHNNHPVSQPGLATAKACSEGIDTGYFSFRHSLTKNLAKAWARLART